MRHRQQQKLDQSQPFKFIATKQEFDALPTNQDNHQTSEEEEEEEVIEKKEIIIPEIQIVEPVLVVKPFAKITPNYIRLKSQFILPKYKNYELTENDVMFIKTNEQLYLLDGKSMLSDNFLRKSIIELQLKAGKSMILPKSKLWLSKFIEKQYPQLLKMESYDQFTTVVYSYWKAKREQFKFPLLRLLWKPEQGEHNNMKAFKSRERERRNLRKHYRMGQIEILQQLLDEFTIAIMATQRIVQRQNLKCKLVQLNILSFYYECGFLELPDFVQQFSQQLRRDDEQLMKKFQLQMRQLRVNEQPSSYFTTQTNTQQIIQTNTHQQVPQSLNKQAAQAKSQQIEQAKIDFQVLKKQQPDKKKSVLNFLASVFYEAQIAGINCHEIFVAHSTEQQSNKSPAKSNGVNTQLKSNILNKKFSQLQIENKTRQQAEQSIRSFIQKGQELVNKSVTVSQNDQIDESASLSSRSHGDYLDYMKTKLSPQLVGCGRSDQLEVKKSLANSRKGLSLLRSLTKKNPSRNQN